MGLLPWEAFCTLSIYTIPLFTQGLARIILMDAMR